MHVSRNSRLVAPRLCLACLVVTLTARAGFSQTPEESKVEKQVETLITADKWPIKISYFKSPAGEESPVVVLLHNREGNRLVWDNAAPGRPSFAELLNRQGYAVISVDLRKHGESKEGPNGGDADELEVRDYLAMVAGDLEAVKEFIFKEHQDKHLNMRKMAIVAPEMSAPLAVFFTLNDWAKKPYDDAPTVAARTPRGQDVRILILLSPDDQLPKMATGRALQAFRNPAWDMRCLVVVGNRDPYDKGQARKVHKQLTGNKDSEKNMQFKDYDQNLRGTNLIGKKLGVEEYMAAFLKINFDDLTTKHAAALQWEDRRPRYDRN